MEIFLFSGGLSVTSTPPMYTLPPARGTSPATALSRVDFPLPEGPNTTRPSPASTYKFIFFNAEKLPYLTETSLSSTERPTRVTCTSNSNSLINLTRSYTLYKYIYQTICS